MNDPSKWAPWGALALTGCCSFSARELANSLREDDIRCLATEDDMTVASPYDVENTASLVRDVRAYLGAIEALLEVEMPSNLHVEFPPVDMPDIQIQEREDGSWDLENFRIPSHHGIRGYSTSTKENPLVTVFVARPGTATLLDGTKQTAVLSIGNDALLRHELGHACARQADLDGPVWFDEAIAEEFEYRELDEDGSLVPIPLPSSLRMARDGHDAYTIDDVLDWEEDARAVAAGEEEPFYLGRPLAHSLLRFLLVRTPGDSLRAQLERIEAMDREELRALGPEWKAWLDALPSA